MKDGSHLNGHRVARAEKSLVGRWRKITTSKCSGIYPHDLEFRRQGLYTGLKGEGRREFTLWDAGEYRVLSEDEIRISTANDALITYRFTMSGDTLTFVDKDGCEFKYRRAD